MSREDHSAIARLVMLGLESHCPCCTRSWEDGDTPSQETYCHCSEEWRSTHCKADDHPDHYDVQNYNTRTAKNKLKKVTQSNHLSSFCHQCEGTGLVLTDAGERLLDFIKRRTDAR